MSETWNRWTCQYHGYVGRTDDNSYLEHCADGHGGAMICVMHWRACSECGKPEGAFACRVRHISINTGWAKSAND